MTESSIEDSFWKKIRENAEKIGRTILISALILYFVMADDDTPKWARSTIFAALVYFIHPLDFIPDPLLPVGYSDDAAVLAGALFAVAAHVKDVHKEKAEQQVNKLFGGARGEAGADVPA